jgi:hypothetical protein
MARRQGVRTDQRAHRPLHSTPVLLLDEMARSGRLGLVVSLEECGEMRTPLTHVENQGQQAVHAQGDPFQRSDGKAGCEYLPFVERRLLPSLAGPEDRPLTPPLALFSSDAAHDNP